MMLSGPHIPSFWRQLMAALAVLAVTASCARAQNTHVPDCSQQRLLDANSAYSIGRFPSTFQLLEPCLPDGFSERVERTEAWRLMALSYLAIDSLVEARASIRSLLRVDSHFQPNRQVDPVRFVGMVSDLKPRWYSWPWKGNEWYKWVGRGMLVGTAAVLPLVLKKKGPLPALPIPPDVPVGNQTP